MERSPAASKLEKFEMRKLSGGFIVAAAIAALLWLPTRSRTQTSPAAARPAVEQGLSFLITFGYQRQSEKVYDGTLHVRGGRLLKLEKWRFLEGDSITAADAWKLRIHRIAFENQPDQPNTIPNASPARNLVPAGLIAAIEPSATSVSVETAQGNFEIPVDRLEYGRPLRFLGDDVIVQRVADTEQLSPDGREEHDYPSAALSKSGSTWFAWQAYQDRGDRVYVARAGRPPQVITEGKADIYRTALAEDGQSRMHVVWSERSGEDWQLWERMFEKNAWSPRRRITREHSPNISHKLIASSDGKLHLIWTGYEAGQSYLYLTDFDGTKWNAPKRIGGPSVWSPALACDTHGNVLVAWDSYQTGNYDIFFRRIDSSGTLAPVEQITTSPKFQAHPSLAVDNQDRVWLAWDESGVNWGKDWTHTDPYRSTVLYQDRAIRVAVKAGGVWKEAPDFGAAVPDRLHRYAQLPHLAIDKNGRVWALFQMRTGATNTRQDFWTAGGLWDLYTTTLDRDGWRPAAIVPHSTSRNEQEFQAIGGTDRIWMTWTNDGRELAGISGGYNGATMVHYNVWASSIQTSGSPGDIPLNAFVDGTAAGKPVHANEAQDVARMRGYTLNLNGSTYRIFRGDFHRHTDISADGSGDGSLEDYYRYMIDVAAMDTGIVTDHNMGGDVEYNWWRTEKSYDLFHIRDRYTPLFGYERSVPYPNGHRNVVFPERGTRTLPIGADENSGKLNSGPILYPYLRQARGICMEHSLATGQGTDYRDNDPELEPLVEIYQGYHAAYEYEGAPRAETATNNVDIHGGYRPAGFWWNALARGLKLGVQASSDHISTHTSYAMIYTPSNDRKAIVESMRQRHAYAATDNILVDFEAEASGGDRHLMGDAFVDRNGQPKLIAKIEGTERIKQIDLIRNNQFVYTSSPDNKSADFTYTDRSPTAGESYYYVRVMQVDGNLAWSSPIWIKR